MKINLGKAVLDVRVRYDHSGLPLRGNGVVARTVATIQDGGGEILGVGEAIQNPKDKPNRVTGRNLALTRALDDAGLDRVDRAVVWGQLKLRGWKGLR